MRNHQESSDKSKLKDILPVLFILKHVKIMNVQVIAPD